MNLGKISKNIQELKTPIQKDEKNKINSDKMNEVSASKIQKLNHDIFKEYKIIGKDKGAQISIDNIYKYLETNLQQGNCSLTGGLFRLIRDSAEKIENSKIVPLTDTDFDLLLDLDFFIKAKDKNDLKKLIPVIKQLFAKFKEAIFEEHGNENSKYSGITVIIPRKITKGPNDEDLQPYKLDFTSSLAEDAKCFRNAAESGRYNTLENRIEFPNKFSSYKKYINFINTKDIGCTEEELETKKNCSFYFIRELVNGRTPTFSFIKKVIEKLHGNFDKLKKDIKLHIHPSYPQTRFDDLIQFMYLIHIIDPGSIENAWDIAFPLLIKYMKEIDDQKNVPQGILLIMKLAKNCFNKSAASFQDFISKFYLLLKLSGVNLTTFPLIQLCLSENELTICYPNNKDFLPKKNREKLVHFLFFNTPQQSEEAVREPIFKDLSLKKFEILQSKKNSHQNFFKNLPSFFNLKNEEYLNTIKIPGKLTTLLQNWDSTLTKIEKEMPSLHFEALSQFLPLGYNLDSEHKIVKKWLSSYFGIYLIISIYVGKEAISLSSLPFFTPNQTLLHLLKSLAGKTSRRDIYETLPLLLSQVDDPLKDLNNYEKKTFIAILTQLLPSYLLLADSKSEEDLSFFVKCLSYIKSENISSNFIFSSYEFENTMINEKLGKKLLSFIEKCENHEQKNQADILISYYLNHPNTIERTLNLFQQTPCKHKRIDLILESLKKNKEFTYEKWLLIKAAAQWILLEGNTNLLSELVFLWEEQTSTQDFNTVISNDWLNLFQKIILHFTSHPFKENVTLLPWLRFSTHFFLKSKMSVGERPKWEKTKIQSVFLYKQLILFQPPEKIETLKDNFIYLTDLRSSSPKLLKQTTTIYFYLFSQWINHEKNQKSVILLEAKKLKDENSHFDTGIIDESLHIKLAEKLSLLGSSGLEEAFKLFKELDKKSFSSLATHKTLITALCMAFKEDRIKLANEFFLLIDAQLLQEDSTRTQQSFDFIFDCLLKSKNSKEKLEQGYSIIKKLHDALSTKRLDKIGNELFSISPKLAIQWTLENKMNDEAWLKKLVMESSVDSDELVEHCLSHISNKVYPATQWVFIIKKALFHIKNMGLQTRMVEIFIPYFNEIEKEDLFSIAQTIILLFKNKKKISCLEDIISACIKNIDHNTTQEDKNTVNELFLFLSKYNFTLSIEYLKQLLLFKKFIPHDVKITEELICELSLAEFRILISSYPKEKYAEAYKFFQWIIKSNSVLERDDFECLLSISIHLFYGVLKTSYTDFANHSYWKTILDTFKKVQDTFEKIDSKKTILIDNFQPDSSLIFKQLIAVHLEEEKFLDKLSKSQIFNEFSNVLKLLEEEKFLDKLLKNQINFVADWLTLIHHPLFTNISDNKQFNCIRYIEKNRKILLSYALKQNKSIITQLINKMENHYFYDYIELLIELANESNSLLSVAASVLNEKSDEGYIYQILKKNKIHQQLNEEELLNKLNKQTKKSIDTVSKIDNLISDLADIDYNKFIRILFLLQNFQKESTSKILLTYNHQQMETIAQNLETIIKNFEIDDKIESIQNFLEALTSYSDKSSIIKNFPILIDQLVEKNSFFYLAPDKLFNIIIVHYNFHLYEQKTIELSEKKNQIKLNSETISKLIRLGLATKEDSSLFYKLFIDEFEIIKNSIKEFYIPLANRMLNSRSEFISTLSSSYQIKFYECLSHLVLEFDMKRSLRFDHLFQYMIKINRPCVDPLILTFNDFYKSIQEREKKCQLYLFNILKNSKSLANKGTILSVFLLDLETQNKIEKLNLKSLEKSFFFICSNFSEILINEKNQITNKSNLSMVFIACKLLQDVFSEKNGSHFLLQLWLKLLDNCKEITMTEDETNEYITALSIISTHLASAQLIEPLIEAYNFLEDFYIPSKIHFIHFINFAHNLYTGLLNIELTKKDSLELICKYQKEIIATIISNCKEKEDYQLFYSILPVILSRTMNRFFEYSFTLSYKWVESNKAYRSYHLNLINYACDISLKQKIEELDEDLEKEKKSQWNILRKSFQDYIFDEPAKILDEYFENQNFSDKVKVSSIFDTQALLSGELVYEKTIHSFPLESTIVYSRLASNWLESGEMKKVNDFIENIDLSKFSERRDLIVKNLIILAYTAFINKKTDFFKDLLISIENKKILFTSEETIEFYSVLISKFMDNPFLLDFATFEKVIKLIENFISDKNNSSETVSLFILKTLVQLETIRYFYIKNDLSNENLEKYHQWIYHIQFIKSVLSLTPIKTALMEKFQYDLIQNSDSPFDCYKQIYNKDNKIKFSSSTTGLGWDFVLKILKNAKEIINGNSWFEIYEKDKPKKIIEKLLIEYHFDNDMKEKLLNLL